MDMPTTCKPQRLGLRTSTPAQICLDHIVDSASELRIIAVGKYLIKVFADSFIVIQ